MRLGSLAWSLAVFTLACSDDGASRPSDPPRVCNELVIDGPEVSYVVSPSAAPVPAGGTIAEGEYELSRLTFYSATRVAPPDFVRAVMVVSGDTMQQAATRAGDEVRYTSTFSASGVDLTISDTCPGPNVDEPAYTATAAGLSLFSDSSGDTFEVAFSKR